MFDIGWSELLVIAVVAIVVVGPKELPRMLRTFGRTLGTVRRTANDFRRQFDEALREAEREADLEGTRKSLQSVGKPVTDLKKDLEGPAIARPIGSPAKPAGLAAARPAAEVHEAEPVKTGAADAERGSDAA